MAIIENYDGYINTDLDRFIGKWVAIIDKKVVASNDDIKKMIKDLEEKYPGKKPLIAKVPTKDLMVL